MRYSVEAYNIYDGDGNTLYDGDLVEKDWGGGTDNEGRFTTWCFHRLKISKNGRLSISGCSNIVKGIELIRTSAKNPLYTAYGLHQHYKVYR